jgi:hypothetical protein
MDMIKIAILTDNHEFSNQKYNKTKNSEIPSLTWWSKVQKSLLCFEPGQLRFSWLQKFDLRNLKLWTDKANSHASTPISVI